MIYNFIIIKWSVQGKPSAIEPAGGVVDIERPIVVKSCNISIISKEFFHVRTQ